MFIREIFFVKAAEKHPMSSSTRNPRKCKARIDDNGEPVTLGKKKMLEPRPMEKLKKAPTVTDFISFIPIFSHGPPGPPAPVYIYLDLDTSFLSRASDYY
jgi:hypothetical protein